MDTKWKKWKSNLACFSFVLGVSLLLIGGIGCLQRMRYNDGLHLAWKLLQEKDYQNRREFRSFIENRLNSFLKMACGEAVYDNYDGDYYGEYENVLSGGSLYITDVQEAVAETDIRVEQAEEETDALQDTADIDDGSTQTESAAQEGRELTEKEKKDSILSFHNAIKHDKNILYSISYLGKEIYSNRWGSDWDGKAQTLPEGYNFCLHFDGKTVTIQKDGRKLDVYGDGIYRENSDWCVPGYQNFAGKTDWKGADIVLLAAKEPVPFLKDLDEREWGGYGNGLYGVYRNYLKERNQLFRTVFSMAAGLALFLLYLLLRNGRGELNGRIAAFTAKIWFELKALLGLALPVTFFCSFLAHERMYGWEMGYYYGASAEEYVSELSEFLLNGISWHMGPFLLSFWLFYLFVLDWCKNRGSYKNGICGKWAAKLDSRGFSLSVSGRMVRRVIPVFALTVTLLIYVFCLFMVSILWDNRIDRIVIWWLTAAFALLCSLLAAEYALQRNNRETAEDLERLAGQISGIRDGNYNAGETLLVKDPKLRQMAQELEDIRQGLGNAVEERIHSERMKVELVANVSHDIKTPLTSIISYIKLLKQEEGLPAAVMDYIHILDEKSERLKNMVQDVFAVSKAASGQLSVEKKELDLGKLLYQTLADMEELVKNSPVTVKTQIPKEPVIVCTDGQRMYRVFQNLIGNALKYSLTGSRIYVTLKEEGALAVASVKNTSSQELDKDVEFAERFVRGDESRTDGGSGLGLSIAKSFTEACGGTFTLEVIADLFVVTVSLPKGKN